MTVYLDSDVIIYYVEENPEFGPRVEAKLGVTSGAWVTAELSRMEAVIVPIRDGDAELLADFDFFFAEQIDELFPVTPAVLARAAHIRAFHRFVKTPDAIHVAAAELAGCGKFVTNDIGLTRYPSPVFQFELI